MIGKVKRKQLLYRSKVEYADFAINHVVGCAHGCKYPCYAMMMAKRFGKVKDYAEWLKPKLVTGAMDLLEKELKKEKNKDLDSVHLCFTTDPFMYHYPEVEKLTLRILRKLKRHKIRATVLTKGIYPFELSDIRKYNSDNFYGITLVSIDDGFRRRFEPFAAPFMERAYALYNLHAAGCRTWVSMEPYPTPNLVEQDLMSLLDVVSFVDKIVFGKINYNSKNGEDHTEFYKRSTAAVISFCLEHNIDFHIKHGTPGAPVPVQDSGEVTTKKAKPGSKTSRTK